MDNKTRLEQYQNAIDKSNIVSKTDVEGNITFVNDEFCKISKYSKEELLGANHNIVRHPDVSRKIFEKLWKTILSKKVYKGIIKNLAKDGSVFYLNATVIPILDKNGDIEEFVAIRHDVTEVILLNERLIETKNELKNLNLSLEQKVLEQTKELVKLNKDLEKKVAIEVAKNEEKNKILSQQSKLAAMGEMIANIAHQWRQPLNELSINLFQMKQNINDIENFNDAYEHSKAVIKNMSKTIQDFSDFFKSNKEKELFFVKEAFDDALSMLKCSLIDGQVDVEKNFKDDAKILGFKSELSQAFMNLLSNAMDAMKDLKQADKKIKVFLNKDLEFVEILFFNNGKNIKKEHIDKIFEPYFTTKHPSSGTGLGLYISKTIIENMNGEISFYNTKNGVCFKIKMPINKKEDDEKH
ncbi:PAS sensor-containing two-component system histidine kinase [Campylobacter blaseri]|uniref:histidine kinase n=1 Tax=Campylobacter blaseri TaxID=2042961 RepID=A0A2P8QZG5_9BACT|nr:PAS domain-containing sensor histidine kinase [Campylobacter blaseri]PSM51640.1 PAS domain-containing sensor histidine kinase [Campylobacter blaseri]PSM53433.1 PAS domain-containing sensor histidine kinase [Campylobacter blaseri]QKF86730.1 PAS sensor-containing two-component system histidine kinase [Campylobacter blaseri]